MRPSTHASARAPHPRSTPTFSWPTHRGTCAGTLAGNTREILHKFSVDLPKKHGRGGQSALRFARLRLEKRHNYVRKVAETATQMFITNDKVNVAGIVLAGSADFKNDLAQSDIFDPRLVAKVLSTVDVSYGGENGFNQAIELSAECLSNVKFVQVWNSRPSPPPPPPPPPPRHPAALRLTARFARHPRV